MLWNIIPKLKNNFVLRIYNNVLKINQSCLVYVLSTNNYKNIFAPNGIIKYEFSTSCKALFQNFSKHAVGAAIFR